MKLYRQKVQRILSDVLEKYIHTLCKKHMTKLCSLMIDCSRDSSNKNELLVASTFYDDNKNEIKRIVFKIIEQNQTKSQVLYQTIANLLKENNISFRAIIAVMTDNANEMCGGEGGLTTLMKLKNNSIYSVTCICHTALI